MANAWDSSPSQTSGMVVKVIGGHGGASPGFRTTSYLIDGVLLLDAGSVASGNSQSFNITESLWPSLFCAHLDEHFG